MLNARRVVLAYVFALVVTPLLLAFAMLTYDTLCTVLVVPAMMIAAFSGGPRPCLAAAAIAITAIAVVLPISPLSVSQMIALATVGVSGAICVHHMRVMTSAAEAGRSSERRLSEEMLKSQAIARVSAERFAQLANAVREVFWMTTTDKSQVLYVSPAYEAIWGLSATAVYKSTGVWGNAIHPADRERVATAWATSGTEFTAEYRIVRPDGSVRWVHDKAFPVRDDAGALIAIAGIADDITERRELEEQLRQTQKLESLGLLAGGVAHDFNNILGVITANANMLAEELPDGHADRELVDEIDAAVARAAALTRQLLAFSRKQVTDPVVLDLNRAVVDTRKMLRRLVGEDVVVRTSLEPDLGRVRVDPSALVQVLMNLAVNARDAMPEGGILSIATRSAGTDIVLSVTDTGCGMPRDVLDRVFEPFFTTKAVGKGTGLGLPVVHGIVQQAGGTIEIESEPGRGTTFRIRLPRVDAPADPVLDRVAIAARGHEKIVLAEDDCYVRAAASRALRARGYTVLEASDGRAALRVLRDHKQDVRLLVTDIVMPGMNGRELAELARERMPKLRVLFMSGYADDDGLRQSVQHAGVHFIEKPFRIQAFAAKVRQVLDEADEATAAEVEWAESTNQLTQPLCERELDKRRAEKPSLATLAAAS